MIDALLAQLPPLIVVTPLIAATLCVIVHQRKAAWAIYTLAAWATLAMAATLVAQVHEHGPISYAVGGWQPPYGIQLRIDMTNALVAMLVTGMAAMTAVYALASVAAEISAERAYLFYGALSLCLAGLLGMTVTGDAFNLFVFLEISSLASYGLIAMGDRRRALLSAFQYLIMGTVGGTFLLIGIGFVYVMTGTLNMADMAARLPAVADTRTVQAGLAFIVVGLSLKCALFPLHLWLPNAYAEAPSAVSAFIAATSTKVAVYALIRLLFTVFGAGYVFGALPLGPVLIVVSVAAMLWGSMAAIFQTDLKRLLAWSSIAQMGYIVLGFALASVTGVTASLVHIVNHGVIKGALFLAAGALFLRLRSTSLAAIAGMGRRMPWTAAALVIGGLGLIGVPVTAGFISKWVLLSALVAQGRWFVIAAVLISSLMALVYVGKVVEALYFRAPAAEFEAVIDAPLPMRLATGVMAGACIGLGVYAAPLVAAARTAACGLLGVDA